MDVKKLFREDDAVSPVIGVILMVAITVILAAVIASFVLNLGGQVDQTTPQASWTFEYDEGGAGSGDFGNNAFGSDGALTITHDGGDSIDENRLSLRDDDGNTEDNLEDAGFSDGSQISAGDSFTIDTDNDDTVRIVYTPEGGDSSTTLATFEAPQV